MGRSGEHCSAQPCFAWRRSRGRDLGIALHCDEDSAGAEPAEGLDKLIPDWIPVGSAELIERAVRVDPTAMRTDPEERKCILCAFEGSLLRIAFTVGNAPRGPKQKLEPYAGKVCQRLHRSAPAREL